ncbi:MAG: GNAT family N-acetyltransferase [Candidatus Omnitrophica bacterium]|nr:GNAT family N-acetyltransferase [Candidatus Omnitrophota bacterium]
MLSAKRKKIGYLVIKLENSGTFYSRDLLRLGMKLCGESVDLKFTYRGGKKNGPASEYYINLLKPCDIEKIKTIASDAFRRSYLYRCGFSKMREIDRYHATWVENLSKDKDVHIFIAKENNKAIGFLALKINKIGRYGRIILIAVHKKYRGRGAGSALVHRCIEWGNKKIDSIFVKTQKDNRNAIILYKKMGFKLVGTDKVFCKKISGR